jgi:hypothetical protein
VDYRDPKARQAAIDAQLMELMTVADDQAQFDRRARKPVANYNEDAYYRQVHTYIIIIIIIIIHCVYIYNDGLVRISLHFSFVILYILNTHIHKHTLEMNEKYTHTHTCIQHTLTHMYMP